MSYGYAIIATIEVSNMRRMIGNPLTYVTIVILFVSVCITQESSIDESFQREEESEFRDIVGYWKEYSVLVAKEKNWY
jgi:hypothetical protein